MLTGLGYRGKMTIDRGKNLPMMKCQNWECGVVIPVFSTDEKGKELERTGPAGMEVFAGVVPVPMRVPAEPIDGVQRKPWFNTEISEVQTKEKGKRHWKGR